MATSAGGADLEASMLEKKKTGSDLRKGYTSHWHVPKHEHLGGISGDAVKAGFRKKVYAILSIQIGITGAICMAFMYSPILNDFALQLLSNSIVFGCVTIVPLVIITCFLMAQKNNYPANAGLLVLFTVANSMTVGVVCAIFAKAGMASLVLEAFVITMGVFIGLTAFVMLMGDRLDLGLMGGFLFVMLMAMLTTAVVGIFIPSVTQNILYASAGAVLFAGYIIFDTWRIEQVFGPDDYIIAAIEIYLDLINMFLYILQILAESK